MSGFRNHISNNKRGHMVMGGVDVVELAEKFDTPIYIYDEERIRERYREFRDAFQKHYPETEIHYAYKANSSLAILHALRQEGAGADILSEGELYLALTVGVPPEKIIFTGNNKTDRELNMALDAGVIINLDSLHELDRLVEIAKGKQKEASVSFRVNPEVSPETHPHLSTGLKESKFGIHEDKIQEGYRKAIDSRFIEPKGIHMHIGSQITKAAPYQAATSKLFDIIGKLKNELALDLEFVDLGGGVGIRYHEKQSYITPDDLARAVIPVIESKIKEHGIKKPKLLFEPGRFIVGDSGVMLTKVSTVKRTPFKKFIGTDSGFHILLRPAMYGSHHDVYVANKMHQKPEETVDIAGNVCESGDILAKDRFLPEIQKNDLIAFADSGAYGIIMASQYNSRPRPPEILVKEGSYELIRERENLSNLIENQIVPTRLLRK